MGAAFGCPEDACRSSDSYRSALDQISCTSPDVEDLQANANWTQYLDNVVIWGGGLGEDVSAVVSRPPLFWVCSRASVSRILWVGT